jgi:hypothetical protein
VKNAKYKGPEDDIFLRPQLIPLVVLSGLVIIVLAIGPQVRGFKPGRGQLIFEGDTNPL